MRRQQAVSGIQWHAAVDGTAAEATSSRPVAPRRVPPVELPGREPDLAEAAAARLGWHGSVLPPATLLGRHVVAVAVLDAVAHAERLSQRAAPAMARAEVATWMWPEFAEQAPPPAVELVGVVSVQRHWRTALAQVAPFAGQCDIGIVLPWSAAMTSDYLTGCLPRAARFGVSVLTADPDGEVNLDQCGRQEPLLAEESLLGRWVNEQVYDHILAL
jgi:hypothetical protein